MPTLEMIQSTASIPPERNASMRRTELRPAELPIIMLHSIPRTAFKTQTRRLLTIISIHVDKVSPRNASETRAWVRDNPTPGSPSPATPGGTPNDATPRIATAVVDSPVMSYTTTNTVTGNQVVVNATLPGHPLGNGIVVRDTTPGPNGTSVIHNMGEGNGALQAPGSPVAGAINSVWAAPGMAPPPGPRPSQPWDRCQANPGRC